MKVKSIKELIDVALSNGNKYAEYNFSTVPVKNLK